MRNRTIVYNTDLVDEADVPTTYEELADREYEGRLCLRNANNDYQQSLVASMIAADGEDATVEMLEGWAANAEIFANDVELLEAMAVGACEIGVVNHYYLARMLEEDPDRADRAAVGGAGRPRRAHQHLRRRRHQVRRRRRPRPAVPRVAGHRRAGRPSWPTTTSTRPTRRSRPSR